MAESTPVTVTLLDPIALRSQRDFLYTNTLVQVKAELLEAIEAHKKASQRLFALRRAAQGLSLILDKPLEEVYDFPKMTPTEYAKLRK